MKNNLINFTHELPEVELISSRHAFIVDFCENKKALHIGCVDSGLLEERYNKNELLHQKLDKVSTLLYGIDIDDEGIEFLKNKGFENLYSMDISENNKDVGLYEIEFDVIILSEVIEHLNNPGIMLDAVKNLMTQNTQLLISVPNAFNSKNIWNMLKGIEYVHPDHNYYFSYLTLNNMLEKNGLDIRQRYIYSFSKYANSYDVSNFKLFYWELMRKYRISNGILGLLKTLYLNFIFETKNFFENQFTRFLFSKTHFFGDGLLVICKLK